MTSKLYAESAPRGFKSYQVEIPVAKVLNRIQQEGKQEVTNIDTVAKAEKNRNRVWLESKLHADKVTLDNIKENHRFSEKNKERIAKAEQKELDDRVKSAQLEYNRNARRPPDKSLLEKLGPALAKAIPQVVGAVQTHQAGLDKAAGEAAQEIMWKLDLTSAEYNDMISHHNSLRGDTVAQEAYYESLIGQFSDKTGHVFTRDDFVRLLEDGTGAYSIAAQGVAAMNGMSAYEQNMKMWELENKRKYNDPVLYQQALEKQSIVARDAAFGKDYFNSELSHYVKFTKIKPEFDKVTDAMLSRHHSYLDREAEYTHGLKESSNYTVFAAENDYASWGQHIEGRVVIRGGDRNVAYTEMFDTLDNLAKTGQLDLQDVNWLMKYGRDSSGNQALGTQGNSNLYSQRVDRLRNLVLNQAHQTNNIIDQQKALGIKNLRQQVQAQLAEEPSASAALKIRDQITNTHEWNGMTHEQQNQFHKLWNPLLKHPKADVRTFEQRIGVPGANALVKSQTTSTLESSAQDQIKLSLKTLAVPATNQGLVQSEYETILEQEIQNVIDNGPSQYRDNTQANLSRIVSEANQAAQERAEREGLFKIEQDPDDPSKYIFTKYGKPLEYAPENGEARRTRYKTHRDDTDKVYLGGESERGRFNGFALAYNEMVKKGGEITRQDIMSYAGGMSYLREMSQVTGIPVSELFANQLKVLHPNITIPDSAITTQEEIRGAEQVINKTLLDLQNGSRGVNTNVSGFYQGGGMPAVNPGVQRTSFTPVSGQVAGYSRYTPPAGRLRGMQGARLKLTDEDWYYIANAVQGEAGPDDDMFYVAANIATRMAMPGAYGSTAKQVVTPAGQYVGYAPGKTINQNLMNRLRSPEGQAKIAEAMKHLDGRESFKGRDLYHNMGEGDIRPNDRSNYYHYAAQGAGKHIKYNPAMAHDHWKRLVIFNDDTYGTGMQSNPPHWTEV